jgi:hypothetical protein
MTPRRPGGRLPAAGLLVAVAAPVLVLALAGCGGSASGGTSAARGDSTLGASYRDHAHDLQVRGSGTVIKVLTDDTDGGRHQRFILRLASGQTLLVAHNIDIAPRVESLRAGDVVAFNGVYEWNAEGGAIHWTHHDPDGDHAAGWLRLDGVTYQ